MAIPVNLYQQIVEFLISLPNVADRDSQRALLFSAGLDPALLNQISFGGSPRQFFQLLIPLLDQYGKLEDGREALVSVLEAAKNYVGQDKRKYCNNLIQQIETGKSPNDVESPKTSPSSGKNIIDFQEIPNPFIYGNPIRPEEAEVFVGRLDIVERIKKLTSCATS